MAKLVGHTKYSPRESIRHNHTHSL